MAAGGPADHWFTDILSWRLPAFDEPCDALIREIHDLGGDKQLQDGAPLGRRLNSLWWPSTRAASGDPELRELRQSLQSLRDQLHAEAVEAGWEVE
ncbi:hypothetical protein [Terrabacter sp. BE26]|uniref:hypothetical protein n=1 Tax=Terrabacter sp. BE26 TaxID=2898152 RepID=UPI0035BE30F3